MERNYKGINFNYHINTNRGIIKVFSDNIDSESVLDENFRYTVSRYNTFRHGTTDAEFTIHGEFVDLITREEFWR